MSGWIKMGTGLRRHPKVVRMVSALKADRLRVIGALHAVWCVFDEHSHDGRLDGYTLSIMDEEVGWRGFSAAMAAIGWLVEDADGLAVPDYEEHNGPTAKRRALDAQSKGKRRRVSSESPPDVRIECGQVSASEPDTLRNREEEIRGDSSVPNGTDGAAAPAHRKAKSPEDRAKADLWKAAVAVLAAGGCESEPVARSFMGKLVKDYGLDPVRDAVAAAATNQPADAREYLKATCQRLKGERKDPVTVPGESTEAYLARMERERAATAAHGTKPPAAIAELLKRAGVSA